jgi:uncharacterized protein YndB with AHSA1/START domain
MTKTGEAVLADTEAAMSKTNFVYVTYIGTTAEKVWQAFTDADVTPRGFRLATSGTTPLELVSDWKPGSPWQRRRLDEAKTADVVGTVLEIAPPHRLVLTWARPQDAGNSELTSRVTLNIEPQGDGLVKLTFQHQDLDPEMLRIVSGGWPQAVSNLKSLLETGHSLPDRTLLRP